MFMCVCITSQNNFKYEYMRKMSTIKLHFSNKNNFILLNFILTFLLLGQSDFDGSLRLSIIPVF